MHFSRTLSICFSNLLLVQLIASRDLAEVLSSFLPQSNGLHPTERCSRSHHSPSRYVTLLTCKLALSALMKIAFNGPQPRASNPDSVLSDSSRNSDSTDCSSLACRKAGTASSDCHTRGWACSARTRCTWGKTENTKHPCLLQECTAAWKGLQTQQSARGASTFTTCSYPETELTSKIINSYIPRNKTEWYWSKRLFERLMEIFQSRPCSLAGKRVTSFPSYRSHPLRNWRVHHLDWRASSVRLSSTHLPYKLCRACSVGIPSSLSAPSTLVSNIPPPPLPTSPNIPRWTFH